MNRPILAAVLSMSVAATFAQVKKPAAVAKAPVKSTAAAPAAAPFKNDVDSVSYAVGTRIAQSMKSQGFDKINMAIFDKAIADVLHNNAKPLMSDAAINNCLGEFQQKSSAIKAAGKKKEGQAFLAANAKRPGVVTLPDGLQYEIITPGTGTTHPTLSNKVKCHYHGTLIDGTVFDSSVDRGEPITFGLSNVIRGWQEALQLMTVGAKWKLYIPSDLAYGDNAASPTIGPGATLIFVVELLGIEN